MSEPVANELQRSPNTISRMQTLFTDKQGRVLGVNKKRVFEAPFMLDTNPPRTVVMMPLPLQGSETIELRLAAEGPLQIAELVARKTDFTLNGSGTITIVGPFPQVTINGNGTQYQSELNVGDTLNFVDDIAVARVVNVATIVNQTQLTVTGATGLPAAATAVPYTITKRFQPCLVKLYARDGVNPRELCNNWIHRDTIFGSLGKAYPLAEALYADETRALAVVCRDISAAGATANLGNGFQMTAPSGKYKELQDDPTLSRIKERLKQRQFLSVPFFYTLDNGPFTLPPLGYAEQIITVSEDHHFELHQLSAVCAGDCSINILDLAKGESIIYAPAGRNYMIPHQLLFGNNGWPYRYPEPITIFAGQKLLVRMQETAGAAATVVYPTLGGKIIPVRQWS